jgi:hypothetical protein
VSARSIVPSLAVSGYVALAAATAPAWPDDWDGVGFVESVRDFDLARFQPHPPGYPVYVALLRVANLVAHRPMAACVLVAVGSGATAVVMAWQAARRLSGELAAWVVCVLIAVAPLSWRACTGVGSEAPALACAAVCAWGLTASRDGRRAGAVALGIGAGLGLGVRLSWAPLYVAALGLAPRRARTSAWAVAAASGVAWAVPFAIVVGPARLVSLCAAHFAGHAARWGGTIATDPGARRAVWLARDLFVDGLGVGGDPLGLAIGASGLIAVALGLHSWRRSGWTGAWPTLVAIGPYLAWIAIGQNLRDQPRHALPAVAAVAAGLGLSAARSRFAFAIGGTLAVLVATRTALDEHARRTLPPPGAQLVALARAQPFPERLAVFGSSSVRFFESSELAGRAFTAGSFGDVELALTRIDPLPSRVWLTSEIEGLSASRRSLSRIATLCRPPRIERRMPCVEVYEWRM